MKNFRILLVIFIFVLTIGLASCKKDKTESDETTPTQITNPPDEIIINFKDLVVEYTGEKYVLEIDGKLPADVWVEYENNIHSEPGEHEVKVFFYGEFEKYGLPHEMTALLIIKEKEEIEPADVWFDSQTFKYDGMPHSIYINGYLPEEIEVWYEGNEQVEPGVYVVHAYFDGDFEKYGLPPFLSAEMTIEEPPVEPIDIRFEDLVVTYTGEIYTLEISGILPDDVNVTYDNNSHSEPGEYLAIARFSGNYQKYGLPRKMTATLIIEDVYIEPVEIRFEPGNFDYDGNPHSVYVSGELPEDVEVWYEGNEQVEPGEYTVIAHFTGEIEKYGIPETMETQLYIYAYEYDFSELVFESKEVFYDGNPHSLEAYNVPENATVWYQNNNKTEPGNYTVTLFIAMPGYPTFTFTANLIIKEDSLRNRVSFKSETTKYDGTPKSIYVTGDIPENIEITYTGNEVTGVCQSRVTAYLHDPSGKYEDLTLSAYLTVEKGTYDFSNFEFKDQTVSYDGENHTYQFEGDLPSTIRTYVEGGFYYRAGEYEYTLYLSSDYYEVDGITYKAKLKIVKDGKYHEITLTGDPLYDDRYITVENGGYLDLSKQSVRNKVGYDVVWDQNELSNITSDVTVTASYVLHNYKIEYKHSYMEGFEDSIVNNNPTTFTILDEEVTLGELSSTLYGVYFRSYGSSAKEYTFTVPSEPSNVTVYTSFEVLRVAPTRYYYVSETEEVPVIKYFVPSSTNIQNINLSFERYSESYEVYTEDGQLCEGNDFSLVDGLNKGYVIVYSYDQEYQARYDLEILRYTNQNYEFICNDELYLSGNIDENNFIDSPTVVPEKPGYRFIGWSIDQENVVDFPYQITENTSFYAIYEAIEYTISLDVNGGIPLEEDIISIYYGEQINLPTPTHANYIFAGWINNDELFTQNVWENTESIVLKAEWNLNVTIKASDMVIYSKNYAIGAKVENKELINMGVYELFYDEELSNPFDYSQILSSNLTLYTQIDSGLEFILENDQYYVSGIKDLDKEFFIIPTSHLGKEVVGIKKDAFTGHKIKGLYIPKSIKVLETDFIKDCPNLDIYTEYSENSISIISQWDTVKENTNNIYYEINVMDFITTNDTVYYIDNGYATIISLDDEVKEYQIPTQINNYVVNAISGVAFRNCTNLNRIIIPNSIEEIADKAFASCDNLVIYVEHSDKPVGFAGNWHANQTYYYTLAYDYVIAKDFVIEIKEDKAKVIDYLGNDNYVKIPVNVGHDKKQYTVYSIAKNTFKDLDTLDYILVDKNITKIDAGFIVNCPNTKVIIDNESTISKTQYSKLFNEQYVSGLNVEYINDIINTKGVIYGVSSNHSLSLIEVINKNITDEDIEAIFESEIYAIADYGFKDCINLKTLDFIEKTTVYLGEYAFSGCSNLERVYIVNNNPTDKMFEGCGNTLFFVSCRNNEIKQIGDSTIFYFDYAHAVSSIYEEDGIFYRISGKEYSTSDVATIIGYLPKDSLTINESITINGNEYRVTFSSPIRKELDTLKISSIEIFGNNLITEETNLKNLYITKDISEIKLYIKWCVDNIYFEGTASEWLQMNSVNYYEESYLDNVQAIYVLNEAGEYEKLEEVSLDSSANDFNIKGYQGLIKATFKADLVEFPALTNCSNLATVIVEANANVTSIERTFTSTNIESIDLSGLTNLETLGYITFQNCKNLKTIKLPTSIKYINNHVFEGCESIEVLDLSSLTNLETIGYNTFDKCYSLKEIRFPESLKQMDSSDFYSLENLKSIYLPKTATSESFNFYSIPSKNPITIYYDSDVIDESLVEMLKNFNVVLTQKSEFTTTIDGITYLISNNTATVIDVVNYDLYIDIPATISVGDTEYNVSNIALTSLDLPMFTYIHVPNTAEVVEVPKHIVIITDAETKKDNWVNENDVYYQFGVEKESLFVDGDYLYEEDGNYANIVAYFGKQDFITMKDEVAGLIVNTINNYAFILDYNNHPVILMGNKILYISSDSFYGYYGSYSDEYYTIKYLLNNTSFSYISGEIVKEVYHSEVTQIGDYYVRIHDKYLEILRYVGTDSIVTVPQTLKINSVDKEVTHIASYAFAGNHHVEEINVNENIESIGNNAFANMSSLKTVVLPNSLASLGNYVFNQDKNLSSVNIPTSLTAIPKNTFYYCSNLKTINIHENVTLIDEFAFAYSGLEEVVLPEGLKTISDYAFLNSKLKTVIIPNDIATIGQYAFTTSSIKAIYLPTSVSIVNSYAFSHGIIFVDKEVNNSLWKANWRDSNTIVSINPGIASFYIENDCLYALTVSEAYLVKDLSKNDTVVIPEEIIKDEKVYKVTQIVEEAFKNRKELQSITIPNTISIIGRDAFYGCSKLESLYISDLNDWSGIIFENRYANPLNYAKSFYCDNSLLDEIEISNITKVNDYAFVGMKNISKVIINNGVEEIGHYAFAYSEIEYVSLPDSIVSLGEYSFGYTTKFNQLNIDNPNHWASLSFGIYNNPLTIAKNLYIDNVLVEELVFEEGLQTIKARAFAGCENIKVVSFPKSLTTIETDAFLDCINLERVNVSDINSWAQVTFNNLSANPLSIAHHLSCCDELVTTLTLKEDITISSIPFAGIYLDAIDFGSSVINISDNAFANAQITDGIYVESLEVWLKQTFETFKSNPLSIAGNLYFNDELVVDLVIPTSVEEIQKYAFMGCTSLSSVSYEAGVRTTYADAFLDCVNIQKVNVPNLSDWFNSLFASIYANPMYYARNAYLNDELITEITIPSENTTLYGKNFVNNDDLEVVIIPQTVTNINSSPFIGCDNLVIYCEASEKPEGYANGWDNGAFAVYWSATVNPKVILGDYEYILADGVATIVKYLGNDSFVNIPREVEVDGIIYPITTLGGNAFKANDAIKAVRIPSSIVNIEAHALTNLRKIWIYLEISESIDTIAENAWNVLDEKVYYGVSDDNFVETDIAYYLIQDEKAVLTQAKTNDAYVTIPESITHNDNSYDVATIASYAFADATDIFVLEVLGNTLSESTVAFPSNEQYVLVHSGIDSYETYKYNAAKDYSRNHYTIFAVDNILYAATSDTEVAVIKDYSKNTKTTIPANVSYDGITYTVTAIYNYAFAYTNASEVVLPESVKLIYYSGFENAKKLKTVNLDNVTSYHQYAFKGCESLEEVVFTNNQIAISDNMFEGCINLEKVDFGNSVTGIGANAFKDCDKLETVYLPISITEIKANAFSYNENLILFAENSSDIWTSSWNTNNKVFYGVANTYQKYTYNDSFVYLLNENNEAIVLEYIGLDEEIIVFDQVDGYPIVEIRKNAVSNRQNLKEIHVSKSVHTIEQYAINNTSEVRAYIEKTLEEDTYPYYWIKGQSQRYWGIDLDSFMIDDDFRYVVSQDGAMIIDYYGDSEYIFVPDNITYQEKEIMVYSVEKDIFGNSNIKIIYLGANINNFEKQTNLDPNVIILSKQTNIGFDSNNSSQWLSRIDREDVVNLYENDTYVYVVNNDKEAIILEYKGYDCHYLRLDQIDGYMIKSVLDGAFSNVSIEMLYLGDEIEYIGLNKCIVRVALIPKTVPYNVVENFKSLVSNQRVDCMLYEGEADFISKKCLANVDIDNVQKVNYSSNLINYIVTKNNTIYVYDLSSKQKVIDTIDGYPIEKIHTNSLTTWDQTQSLIIGDVDIIEDYAFNSSYLRNIYLQHAEVPSGWHQNWTSTDRNIFFNVISDEFFKVDGISYVITKDGAIIDSVDALALDNIPETVTYNGVSYPVITIASGAISGAYVDELIIPKTVERLYKHAISGVSCKTLTIPNSVVYFEEEAFYAIECDTLNLNVNMKHVNIPSLNYDTIIIGEGIETIEHMYTSTAYFPSTFKGTTITNKYEDFTMHFESIESFYNASFTVVDYTFNIYLYVQDELVTELVVPEGTTEIEAFKYCYYAGIKKIIIPDSVTHIGDYAFSMMPDLEEVQLGKNVVELGYSSFSETPKLLDVYIPASVVNYDEAFPLYPYNYVEKKNLYFEITQAQYNAKYSSTYYNLFFNYKKDSESIFTVDGFTYQIMNEDEVFINKYNGQVDNIYIPNTVSHNDKEYQVTGLITNSFTHLNIKRIYIPTTLTTIQKGSFNSSYETIFYFEDESRKTTWHFSTPEGSSVGNYFIYDYKNQEYITVGDFIVTKEPYYVDIVGYVGSDKTVYIPNTIEFDGTSKQVSKLLPYTFEGCDNLRLIIQQRPQTSDGYSIPISTAGINKDVVILTDGSLVYNGQTRPEDQNHSHFSFDNLTIIDGLVYVLKDNKVKVLKYVGDETEVEVLNEVTINDSIYQVTDIASYAFYNCPVEKVTFNSITSIGEFAFSKTKLKELVIPASLQTVSGNGFNNLETLKTLAFEEGVTRISKGAFSGCSNLETINFATTITHIGANAFSGCSSLTNVTPLYNTGIQSGAFSDCNLLKELIVYGQSYIYSDAINNSVTEVYLPDKEAQYYIKASENFYPSIASKSEIVTVDNGQFILKDDGAWLYHYEFSGDVLEIPTNITIDGTTYPVIGIYHKAFMNNEQIKEVILPEGLIYVTQAFINCSNLEKITISSTITQFEIEEISKSPIKQIINYSTSFTNNISYHDEYFAEAIIIDISNLDYEYIFKEGVVYAYNDKSVIVHKIYSDKELVKIPSTIEIDGVDRQISSVDRDAIYNNNKVKQLIVPNQISVSLNSSFIERKEKLNVYLSGNSSNDSYLINYYKYLSNVEDIVSIHENDEYVYYLNANNEAVIIKSLQDNEYVYIDTVDGYPVITISYSAFANKDNLKSVELSENVQRIESNAFGYCPSLKTFKMTNSIFYVENNIFNGSPNVTHIVSSENYDDDFMAYRSLDNLKVITINDVIYLVSSKYVKEDYEVVRYILLNDVLTYGIVHEEDGCYYSIKDEEASLVYCDIDEDIITVADEITYENHIYKVTSIYPDAFKECHSVKEIYLSNNVCEVIGNYLVNENITVYSTNQNLIKTLNQSNLVLVNDDVDIIEVDGMKYLIKDGMAKVLGAVDMDAQTINIVDSINYNGHKYFVKEIASYAFYNMQKLESVTLAKSITKINNFAFGNCFALESINLDLNIEYIGNSAFVECNNLEIHLAFASVPTTWDVNWNRSNCKAYFNEDLITVDDFCYVVVGDVVFIEKYLADETEVKVAESIEFAGKTYNVAGILSGAFESEISNLYLSTNLKYIAINSFTMIPSNIYYEGTYIPNSWNVKTTFVCDYEF